MTACAHWWVRRGVGTGTSTTTTIWHPPYCLLCGAVAAADNCSPEADRTEPNNGSGSPQ